MRPRGVEDAAPYKHCWSFTRGPGMPGPYISNVDKHKTHPCEFCKNNA